MKTTLGLKVDLETKERLQTLAAQLDRTPHWLMRQALDEYLDREERRERERAEDQARWEQYQLTGRAVEQPEVEAWLGALAAGEEAPCPE